MVVQRLWNLTTYKVNPKAKERVNPPNLQKTCHVCGNPVILPKTVGTSRHRSSRLLPRARGQRLKVRQMIALIGLVMRPERPKVSKALCVWLAVLVQHARRRKRSGLKKGAIGGVQTPLQYVCSQSSNDGWFNCGPQSCKHKFFDPTKAQLWAWENAK